MPLTIVAPGIGKRPFGPGMAVRVQNSEVGPFPNDDYLYVEMIGFFGGLGTAICIGTAVTHGQWDVWATLGKNPARAPFIGVSWGVAVGADVTLSAQWRHADHTAVWTSTAQPVESWDPYSALWVLTLGLTDGSADSVSGALELILASVRKTYTT